MVSCEQTAQTFGAVGSIKDGQGNNVTGPNSRFAYTGREFDPETGNYYYRARYYDPQSGRFLSQDPIGFSAGDMNLYRYVGNSMPNFVDPSGLRAGQHTTTDQPLGRTGPVGPVRYNDGGGPHRSLSGFTPQGDDLSHLYMTTNGFGDPTLDPTIIVFPPGPFGDPIMVSEPYPIAPYPRPEPTIIVRPPGSFPGDPRVLEPLPGELLPPDYLEILPVVGDIGGAACAVIRRDMKGAALAAFPIVPIFLLKRIGRGVQKLYVGSDGKIPQVVIDHLNKHHGINEYVIGDRVHKIKSDNGLCPSDNIIFHLSGDVYHPVTGDFLGSLTQGGAPKW